MADLAIKLENLGKVYRIGEYVPYKTLRETIVNAVKAPLHLLSKEFYVRQRNKVNNTIWALKDLSFEIKKGEVVGIIGRNGAGKTTLLKVLSRVTRPTCGKATLYGRVGSLLEIGTGFHPELTGRENIFLMGAVLGMKKNEIRRKYDEIVSFSGINEFLNTPVKRFSSGMFVRLAFAVAVHLEPEVLFVDEVLAVGDIEFQKKCIEKMEQVAGEGRTILFVSHNMGTIRSLCSKAILLDSGMLKLIGSTNKVVESYLNSVSEGGKVDSSQRIIPQKEYEREVRKFKRSETSIKMRPTRVQLLNGIGNSFTVYWKQSIKVSVELAVFAEIEEVSLGVGIRMLDGVYLVFAHHDDYGINQRWTMEPAIYEIIFTLKNDLMPGIYKLCIGAHSKIYLNNLFHIETVRFEVLNHTQNGLTPLAYNPGIISGDLLLCNKPIKLSGLKPDDEKK